MKILIVTLLLILTACGGDSASEANFKYTGTWEGRTSVRSNDCVFEVPSYNRVLILNQIRSTVVADLFEEGGEESEASVYEAYEERENVLVASRQFQLECVDTTTGETIPGSSSNATQKITFIKIDSDSAAFEMDTTYGKCSTKIEDDYIASCSHSEGGLFSRSK